MSPPTPSSRHSSPTVWDSTSQLLWGLVWVFFIGTIPPSPLELVSKSGQLAVSSFCREPEFPLKETDFGSTKAILGVHGRTRIGNWVPFWPGVPQASLGKLDSPGAVGAEFPRSPHPWF